MRPQRQPKRKGSLILESADEELFEEKDMLEVSTDETNLAFSVLPTNDNATEATKSYIFIYETFSYSHRAHFYIDKEYSSSELFFITWSLFVRNMQYSGTEIAL